MSKENKDKLRTKGGLKSWDLITSTNESCGMNPDCHHIMNPQYRAYKNTIHGKPKSQNSSDVNAKCGQCHLPALNEGVWLGSWLKSKLASAGIREELFSWPPKLTGELPNTIEEGVLKQQGHEERANNVYPRPIHSPAKHLQPVNIACTDCHKSILNNGYTRGIEDYSGIKKIEVHRFDNDARNSEEKAVIYLNVGAKAPGGLGVIHRHATGDMYVNYKSTDGKREEIEWVEAVVKKDGYEEILRWEASAHGSDNHTESHEGDHSGTQGEVHNGVHGEDSGDHGGHGLPPIRRMDCYDCHNRVGHDFKDLNRAIDDALTEGKIDKTLPYIKKVAQDLLDQKELKLAEGPKEYSDEIIQNYRDKYPLFNKMYSLNDDDAYHINVYQAVEDYVIAYYSSNYPSIAKNRYDSIYKSIDGIASIYILYTDEHMRIGWGYYPNHGTHGDSANLEPSNPKKEHFGCFRCHRNPDLKPVKGTNKPIADKCETCHTFKYERIYRAVPR